MAQLWLQRTIENSVSEVLVENAPEFEKSMWLETLDIIIRFYEELMEEKRVDSFLLSFMKYFPKTIFAFRMFQV